MALTPSPQTRGALFADRYSIRRKLGAGSLGSVYLADDRESGKLVALKVLHAERFDARAVSRMQEEFRAIASLDHPQIARAFDFGYAEPSGTPYYTREYIPGTPLPPGPPGKAPPEIVLRPIFDVLDAVEYVHAQGVLHLDIHAGNVILSDDAARGAVLIDFGLLWSRDGPRGSTAALEPSSLPAELLGHGVPSPATDLYLVGRLLHYRLTARVCDAPELPREIPGWGPRRTLLIERILKRALDRAPEKRFASATEMRGALAAALGTVREHVEWREPPGTLVGRDGPIADVESAMQDAMQGISRKFWVRAGRGAGKSRFLAEVRLRAQLRGLRTFAIAFGGGEVEERLTSLLRPASGADPHHRAWLEALAARHGGSPAERAERAVDSFFAEPDSPLVILVDDLERGTGGLRALVDAFLSRATLTAASGSRQRGLVLLVASPSAPARAFPDCRRIGLPPLRAPEARRLFLDLLRPLVPPAAVLRRALARAGGVPLRLRQLARALRREWIHDHAIPASAECPQLPAPSAPVGARELTRLRPLERQIVEVLALFQRAATSEELAAALDVERASIAGSLRSLARVEILSASSCHSPRRFQLCGPEGDRSSLTRGMRPARIRRVHERMVRFFKSPASHGALELECLARHLLALGRRREGRQAALGAVSALRLAGALERAARLLEELAAGEENAEQRLTLAHALSAIHEETGDHERGVAVLEPLLDAKAASGAAVRLRRCLGVHYHRAGAAEKAFAMFEEVYRQADVRRDAEDLIVVDTEIAELHLFRGRLVNAEEACKRGLERLSRLDRELSFRGRMEVMLRASLGHIRLRQRDLSCARSELAAALRLAHKHGTTAERASILHNLAIAENQLHDLDSAKRHFREAERLLLAAGERRNVIKIATNLAVVLAKQGDTDAARKELERAARLLLRFPGRQLEFFLDYARGIVELWSGEADSATSSLERALRLGRQLGDVHLVSYGEVYLAEALLFCGRYRKARLLLRGALRRARIEAEPLLARMAHARLQLIEAILGASRAAEQSRRALAATPRTSAEFLEAFNDVFLGVGLLASDQPAQQTLERAYGDFERLAAPIGIRFARLGLLLAAVTAGEERRVEALLLQGHGETAAANRFLAVAEPLLRAEASTLVGQTVTAEEWLAQANSAAVAAHFLELDWASETLRARLALAAREPREALRHLHRGLHARDLLAELTPPRSRRAFVAHARFSSLRSMEAKLAQLNRHESSTGSLWAGTSYEGMVGRSAAMVRVFQAIERSRDLELPVLIRGETGTGKELVARALHRRSSRNTGPFLALHAATLPDELFAAELFGYSAGAFTGAEEDHPGLLEVAHGGALVLDGVESLPLASQAKLLQALDAGVVRRIGSLSPTRLDVRFLFSTRVDLAEAVAAGQFREDLYYRARGLEIELPPLRERREDVPLLARHFLERHATRLALPLASVDDRALDVLTRHDWPGNVRELETVILRALLHATPGSSLGAASFAELITFAKSAGGGGAPRRRDLLRRDLALWRAELERDYLVELFVATRGDTTQMTKRLGVRRTRLYAWLRELGIDITELRSRLPAPR